MDEGPVKAACVKKDCRCGLDYRCGNIRCDFLTLPIVGKQAKGIGERYAFDVLSNHDWAVVHLAQSVRLGESFDIRYG